MDIVSTLPHWDMTVVYPSMESQEFARGYSSVVQDIDELAHLFDTRHIEGQMTAQLSGETIKTFEIIIERFNAVLEATSTLSTYIMCFITTNTHDSLAQAKMSELQKSLVTLKQLGTRLTAWIGSLDVDALIDRSTVAREHAYMLRKAKLRAAHLMTPAEEALASELNVSSGTAWSKLHSDVTSQLRVPVKVDGQIQELPMSVVRNMADEADRDVRRSAYEAELAGWKEAAVPLAAALNSIKGEVNVLARKRGWQSPLEASLFNSNIDRATLDAMLTAARESFPDFRRYLHAKARALGLSRLAWYDLFAPVGKSDKIWEYDEAARFIVEQFGTYSSRLSGFAARAFREQWIDAEPRAGKVDGAYCTPLRKDESRVFANYKPSYGGVSTLAHELGHGYHNLNLAHRTMLQQDTPMTLAETASIFCETIIREATLRKADKQEQIMILEASLQGSCQVVVDITSRFLFEQRVFEARQQRELSIDELNNVMLEAQRETYGDGLDESVLHPYMWAMKPHYYSTESSFYNYPYMFGLLFGLGLYAQYQQDPEKFKQGYDDLLSSTGLADAATLAAQFGIDIRSADFWRASLNIVRGDIDRFEELTR
ncbi:MAG TPA: oligoendopeptidase F [Ktedonobacter sp.]|jgi:pepF/M3 family oligoendopeptidase|nr:oligoendopeptidase F [Ktedonobacter sp.]HBE24797.1 oligoendopeptidase F [Ktedonobacter sp.]HBE28388.1 oligoendopeptidase F [Ktedonobacter sp.]HCJ36110.1 oligoendopeptidase F [Ktedonobacter sp.]HCP73383.1 oligoendopeptidase F [Ktedonobacter sp.]